MVVSLFLLSAAGPMGCGLAAKAGRGLASRLPGVGGKKDSRAEIGAAGAQVPLGEVSYVDERSRFVLVRTGRTIRLKTGAALEARRQQERVAELSYSPENRRGFLVADILRGNPALGDLVMIHSSEIVDMAAARESAEARQAAYENTVKEMSKERGRKRLFRRK